MKSLIVNAIDARKELKKMHSAVTSYVQHKSFPFVVKEEYVPVWDEYLETKAVKELTKLYKSYGKEVVQLFVCQSFISNLHTSSSNFLQKPYKVSQQNALLIVRTISSFTSLIDKDLHKLTFDKYMRTGSVSLSLTGKPDTFINGYVNPELTLFISLIPKRKNQVSMVEGRHKSVATSVDSILYGNSEYMFKDRKVPPQLLGKKKGTRTTYASIETAKLSRPFNWWYARGTILGLEMIRADKDIILIKVKFPMNACLFLGNDKIKSIVDAMESALKKQVGVS